MEQGVIIANNNLLFHFSATIMACWFGLLKNNLALVTRSVITLKKATELRHFSIYDKKPRQVTREGRIKAW